MNRTDIRESVIKLLYLETMGGSFNKSDYDQVVLSLLEDVLAHVDEIDRIISDNLQNWTIDRLNYVDKAIIRYAVYEMKFKQLPYEIAINEAIEMTKKYSNLDDNLATKFNNRLLDNIKNSLFGPGGS